MPRFIVPDTCALSASLYNEVYAANADPLLQAIRLQTVTAVAPSLGKAEFLNVSRRKLDPQLTAPVLSVADVENAVAEFMSLPIQWVDIDPIAMLAWRLHRDHGLQTADAFFVEIARQYQAEIWTTDAQFYRRAISVYANVYDLSVSPFS